MFSHLFSVVLCGGSGTRLWPLSRTALPKQFIELSNQSLFDDTLDRISSLSEQSIIVCGNQHRFLVADKMIQKKLDLTKHSILLEPMPKNTALAIALSAFCALEKDKEAVLLVLPSDHKLEPLENFTQSVKKALPYTEDNIITFGIKPSSPHTGYGYIINGDEISKNIFKVKSFTEKPNYEKAQKLLESNASWNSGMFLMRADIFLKELEAFRPDIYQSTLEIWNLHTTDLDFTRFNKDLFSQAPAESIDYAVMEKTQKALVYPLDIHWSDLGSFEALHENEKKDTNNNCCIGDVILESTTNSYVHATSSLVAVKDLDNIAVIQTKDAVMVSPLDKTQDLKKLIIKMKELNREELDFHCVYHRPWGHYESLINGDRFQVKHIIVNPGGILSVQMHHHRSEHWIVVKGTALVKVGESEKLVAENQSIYIPLGEVHRLSNPGHIDLEVIEVQTGSYLGEDDIQRLEDAYGRQHLPKKN